MRFRRLVITAIPLLVLLGAWESYVSGSSRRQFLFGSPSAVWRVAIEDFGRGSILRDIAATATTACIGLLGGTLVGTLTALSLWLHPALARIARPYITAVAAIPIFALAPMLIIWFGIGQLPRIIMAGFPVLLACVVTVYQRAAQQHELHEEWMTGLSMTRPQRLRWVIVPEVILGMVQDLRNSVGLAIVGAFIGEFVVSERGLGKYILRAGSLYDLPRVLLGLVLISLLSLVMAGALGLVVRLHLLARRTSRRDE